MHEKKLGYGPLPPEILNTNPLTNQTVEIKQNLTKAKEKI